jgi:ubiquinone/menaquinone biosynthesis C-methylase UbiE
MKYTFEIIENCNMCDTSTSTQIVLGKRLNQSQGKKPKNKIGITTTVCKCSNCGLIYANPLPIPDDIQDHYGVPPESYWKEEYFKVNPDYFLGEISTLKKLIEFKPGLKSLDIGAGLGKQMKALEKTGFETYGFEPSKPFYERAISKMGISSERLKLGMIEEVEYPEECFDFISFGVVLEHVYDPSASINKALKWLKQDGIMHVEVPSSEWLVNKLINWYYKLNLSDYVGNVSPMHEPYHLYEFSLKSFQENSKVNGFTLAHHEYYVCQTFLPKIFDHVIKPYMKKTNSGMQLCVWLKKN